ncbi:hypothetical protein CGLO_09938 [Colletotrichum gloeosporioides Cg-14]|uniref:Uncharacterized protein n=1 Tax=Colletotrichum gloeosporioides (strain Cg-14) TaxID=1237896 RepID=T0K588_COLGC|nr:hypothetical protein CGLO_09938 [Colletotrichum gloeosporioides Cg-14]
MGLRTVLCNVIEGIKSDVETAAFILFNCKIPRRHRRPLPKPCCCVERGRTGVDYQVNPDVNTIDPPPPYSPPSYPSYAPPPYYGTRSRLDTFLDDLSYYSPEY